MRARTPTPFRIPWAPALAATAALCLGPGPALCAQALPAVAQDVSRACDVSLGDQAIAVWANSSQNRIEGCRLAVAATGALSTLTRTILSGPDIHTAPSIAQEGGADGRFLVAWQTTSRVAWGISGAIVNRFLNVLDRPTLFVSSTIRTTAVDVSGDGTHWVVGYDRQLTSTTPPDVYCMWVTLDPLTNAAYLGPEVLVEGGAGIQTGASVTLLGRSVLVGERQHNATTGVHGGFVRSLDQFSCGPCEGFFTLESTNTRDVRRIASAGRVLESLLVWESVDPSTGTGTIKARRFKEEAGFGQFLSNSACGPDVRVFASCPRAGNLGFALRMEHAEPGRPAFVLLQPGAALGARYFACGSGCTLILDPFRSLVFPTWVTDAHGNVGINLPIPAGSPPGLTLSFQFGIVPTGAAGCPALGVSFSRVGSAVL